VALFYSNNKKLIWHFSPIGNSCPSLFLPSYFLCFSTFCDSSYMYLIIWFCPKYHDNLFFQLFFLFILQFWQFLFTFIQVPWPLACWYHFKQLFPTICIFNHSFPFFCVTPHLFRLSVPSYPLKDIVILR
jgi:hypothetical protein